MKYKAFIYFILCFILASCGGTEKLYIKALNDARNRELQDKSFNLTAIDLNTMFPKETKVVNGETYLLMVAWKADANYYKNDPTTGFYNTGNYPVYTTLRSDFNAWLEMHSSEIERDTLRLKQLLGLPPTAVKTVFVEFWVRPQDLVRPCPDAEINDISCDLDFPSGSSCDHILWFTEFKNNSFNDPMVFNRYPFTGFGYTYDWYPKNKTHRGLSEFVIGTNKNVLIGSIKTTDDFLRQFLTHLGLIY